MINLSIVVPVFNESENILPLQLRIKNSLTGVCNFEIVYADGSPNEDTSTAILSSMSDTELDITLVRIPKDMRNGLLSDTLYALVKVKYDYVVVIDGDGQHPPEVIKDMISKIERFGADYVSTSRFIEGGSIKGLHGWHRKFFSLVLRHSPKVVGVKLSDPLTSFCLFDKRHINPETFTLVKKGMMKIQPFLLIMGNFKKIIEVPIIFGDRIHGESTMSLKRGFEFFRELLILFSLKWKIY